MALLPSVLLLYLLRSVIFSLLLSSTYYFLNNFTQKYVNLQVIQLLMAQNYLTLVSRGMRCSTLLAVICQQQYSTADRKKHYTRGYTVVIYVSTHTHTQFYCPLWIFLLPLFPPTAGLLKLK